MNKQIKLLLEQYKTKKERTCQIYDELTLLIKKESKGYPAFELIREWHQLTQEISDLRLKLKLSESR